MAYITTNAGIYIDGYELSGYSNTLTIEIEKELYDCTTFGEAYRTRLPGMVDARFSAAGYFDPLNTDAVLFAESDDAENIALFAAVNADSGPAYFMRGVQGQYGWTGSKSGAGTWTLSGSTTQSPVVRGVMLDRTLTLSATGTSSPVIQHGVVTATQSIYAVLQVFSVAGTATPTVTAIIQSDNAIGFPTPTTRLSFTPVTVVGSQWVSAGPAAITDDFWRVSYTITGTAPVFGLAVGFGIL